MNKLISITVVLCALFGFSQAKAQVTCGDVITTSEVLTSNLTCPTDDPALTIEGPNGSLDMRGFTLSCGVTNNTGIELDGSGARLLGGTVRDCRFGVFATGDGNHVVQQMIARNNQNFNVLIQSPGNRITNTTARDADFGFGIIIGTNNLFSGNTATNNRRQGFFAQGSSTFTGNTATDNGTDGFALGGLGGHTLSQNIARSNTEDGFFVFSQNNTLTSNVARNNLAEGIHVLDGATNNRLRTNSASGNGSFDLQDDNDNCDANVWQFNSGTRNQGCIR